MASADARAATLRAAVSALVAPRVCAAVLRNGQRCADSEVLCDGAQHLVAFVRETPQRAQPPARSSQVATHPAQDGDAKQAPAGECGADVSGTRPSGRKKATGGGKQNAASRCPEPSAPAGAEQPEQVVDLLLAAAIAAEQKPGAGGKKSRAKMLRLLQDSSRVCEDQRAECELPLEHRRLLEAFDILNQLYEVTATNHFETLTLANICSHGACKGGTDARARTHTRTHEFAVRGVCTLSDWMWACTRARVCAYVYASFGQRARGRKHTDQGLGFRV